MEKIFTKENRLVFLVLFLFGFLLFYKIGDNFLTHWDEAWHADISRNVVKTGDLLILAWNKEPFFDKPPLYFWLSAIVMKLLGVSELSARLPSVMAGFGAGVLLFLLAKDLFNRQIAILSLLIFTSTIGFLFRARTGNLDTLLTFWIIASIMAFYKGYRSSSVGWFSLMGAVLGAGFLTKGIMVFIFPVICFTYLFIKKEYKLLSLKFLTGSIVIGVSISILWLVMSFWQNGTVFTEGFLANQIGKLSTTPSFWTNFSFEYIWHLKSGLKIWFVPFILGLLYAGYEWRKTDKILLVVYFLFLLLVLSFSENKSNWFLMPLYPIAALVMGHTIYELGKKLSISILALKVLVLVTAAIQILLYQNEFIVPDIAGDEARIARAAKELTREDEVLYLTNYYYPTIVYYSERKVYAVYSEHEQNKAWWVKPKSGWSNILRGERVFIITTEQELELVKEYLAPYTFDRLYQSGEKILLKKV